MAVPTIKDLYAPVIRSMADGKIHCADKIKLDVAEALQLNSATLAELMPDKRSTVFDQRVEAAINDLVNQDGCVERVSPDHYRLTE